MTLPKQGRAVGEDWIKPVGDDLLVIARVPLREWTASRFRKSAVLIDGTRYFVAEAFEPDRGRPDPAAGRGYRYRLIRWPDDLHDRPSNTLVYDEAFVANRNSERQSAWARLGVFAIGLPFYPLLGLLPSNIKCGLQESFEFDALTSTQVSMRCEYILGVICLGLIVPQVIFGDPLGVGPFAAPIAAGILLLDCGMRWERMKEGGGRQYGALEWIFHRL
ncbi:MAG: hypothetical protein GY725_19785 [bacterium]|nr:hypothetical protein [bacterium]